MELRQEERRALINLAFEKSAENIRAAKCLLNNEIPSKAASAAYYSVFHSMHALFLQYQLVQTKRRGHRSGIDLFHKNFVHAGIFPSEIGKIVGQLEWLRNMGDYSIEKTVTRDDAVKAIANAEKFNAAIQAHVQEDQKKESSQATK
ncbi:MAG: HEPN domain-containing protein [Fretibacterium sp.]|nr:HEPN domain-containing protein [Fretibacterium sp.]